MDVIMTEKLFSQYEEAGCWDYDRAERLLALNILPDAAGMLTPEEFGLGSYPGTLGYKFANGDISESEASAYTCGEWNPDIT